MKVEIKKVNITRNILNQVEIVNQNDLTRPDLEVLGWCFSKCRKSIVKYIVFYFEKTQELKKLLKFNSFDINDDGVFRLINNYPTFVKPYIQSRTTDEFNDLNEKLIKILLDVEEKGQFYI